MKWRRILFPAVVYSLACYSLVLLIDSSSKSLFMKDPILSKQDGVLEKCCISNPGGEDICGRTNCLWNCDTDFLAETKFVQSLGNEAFFHETSGSDTLNYRQACSVESLARLNPELTVNVLMTSNRGVNFTSNQMEVLTNYSNIKFRPIELSHYFLHSPLERWYFCTDWNYGRYAVAHLSDALRYLTLFKFGGYYFDLDFVMIRSLAGLRNFTAAESDEFVAAGALHFDYRHPIILDTINEFKSTYRKEVWNYNGPGALTRVLLKHCNATDVEKIRTDRPTRCNEFNVFPPRSFYPVHFDNWTDYFVPKAAVPNLRNVIGAHTWNKLSRNSLIFKNSSQLYSQLSRKFCPRVFSVAPDAF